MKSDFDEFYAAGKLEILATNFMKNIFQIWNTKWIQQGQADSEFSKLNFDSSDSVIRFQNELGLVNDLLLGHAAY